MRAYARTRVMFRERSADSKPENELGHASACLASDSYITDDSGNILKTDAQKVFASAETPAIFGYVGDQRIAEMLAKVVDRLDMQGLFSGSYGSLARAKVLEGFFAREIPQTRKLNHLSTVVYLWLCTAFPRADAR